MLGPVLYLSKAEIEARFNTTELQAGDWVRVLVPSPIIMTDSSKSDKTWDAGQHWTSEPAKETYVDRIMRIERIDPGYEGIMLAKLEGTDPKLYFCCGFLQLHAPIITETMTRAEFDAKYTKQLSLGDEVRVIARHTNVMHPIPADGFLQAGTAPSLWTHGHEGMMSGRGRVIDVIPNGFSTGIAMCRIKFFEGVADSDKLWFRCASCKLIRNADAPNLNVPFTNIGTVFQGVERYTGAHVISDWPQLYVTIPQFQQRYVDVDVKAGDWVLLWDHPMLYVNDHKCGNFAKPAGSDIMQRWKGRVVTISEVSISTYEVDGTQLRFTRFTSKEVNVIEGATKYWRVGDCYRVNTCDGRVPKGAVDRARDYWEGSKLSDAVPQWGTVPGALTRDMLKEAVEAFDPILEVPEQPFYCVLRESTQRYIDAQNHCRAPRPDPKPVPVPVNPESLMTEGDRKARDNRKRLVEARAYHAQELDRVMAELKR